MDFWCYGCDHWLGQRDLVEKTFAEDFAQCLPNSQEEKNAWRCVDVWRARRREERTWANSAARPLETYYVLEPGWGDSWIQFLVGNGGPPCLYCLFCSLYSLFCPLYCLFCPLYCLLALYTAFFALCTAFLPSVLPFCPMYCLFCPVYCLFIPL
eukprot:g58087.t1